MPTFLLRDDFTTDAAAPLVSPRNAEPGPGALTITDTGNKASVSGGNLLWTTSTGTGDPKIEIASFTRLAGRAALARIDPVANRAQFRVYQVSGGANIGIDTNGTILGFDGGSISGSITLSSGTFYDIVLVLRASGGFFFAKGGIYTSWTLFWVDVVGALTPAVMETRSISTISSMRLSQMRLLDLPAPYASDFGLATQRLAGAQVAGATFTHEANCVLEYAQVTLPSALSTDFRLRRQDASNYWQVVITSTGAFTLNEVVAGTPTQRGTAAAVVTSGHRIVIVADGATIRGYSNNVLRWTYASASNFQTATAGELTALGTGGAVSDVVSWPRQITGTAAAILDAAVGASGDLTATLGAATLQATGRQQISGQLTVTLAPATLVAGNAPIATVAGVVYGQQSYGEVVGV